MTNTIPCARCGHQNVLGRIFCTNCGQKLDFEALDRKTMRAGPAPAARFIRIGIVLALVGAIVMVLKPAATTGAAGGLQEAQRLNQKIRLVRGAVLDGKRITQEVSETELNGYLAEVIKRSNENLPKDKKQPVLLRAINVRVEKDGITVVLLAQAGPITVSYSTSGKPAKRDGKFVLSSDGAKVGLMPVPGAVGSWVAKQASYVFSKLANERALLDQVSNMELRDGSMVVAFGG
jgi:hypothetical protein